MKLWMFIMIGWVIYKAFRQTKEVEQELETQPKSKKRKSRKKHTMLPTYYVPAGSTERRRKEEQLKIAEKATVKQKGMFPEQFINNNTTETYYEEIS